jgi:hypothetical protein
MAGSDGITAPFLTSALDNVLRKLCRKKYKCVRAHIEVLLVKRRATVSGHKNEGDLDPQFTLFF